MQGGLREGLNNASTEQIIRGLHNYRSIRVMETRRKEREKLLSHPCNRYVEPCQTLKRLMDKTEYDDLSAPKKKPKELNLVEWSDIFFDSTPAASQDYPPQTNSGSAD